MKAVTAPPYSFVRVASVDLKFLRFLFLLSNFLDSFEFLRVEICIRTECCEKLGRIYLRIALFVRGAMVVFFFLLAIPLLVLVQSFWFARTREGMPDGGDSGSGVGVCSSALANGRGTNVWSPSVSEAPLHLVVMVHGILGRVSDWKFAAEQFARMLPDKVVVHCSERNVSTLTLDGIDVMGERLAEEVEEVITRIAGVRKISFVAHSLGGLVARYAIGRLYRPSSSEEGSHEGTICGLEAMNFITVATPHLGSRGYKQVPLLFGVAAFERAACQMSHWIFGRTGRHLFLTDCEGEPPLLQRMVVDCGDLYFMSALRAFRRRVAYANVNYDHIVGWRTASIRCNHELPKEHWEDSLSEKYPHIVHEEIVGGCTEQLEPSSCIDDELDTLEDRLASELLRVPWKRVDVSFHTSKWRFVAHSMIQVKIPFMHSEGVDCIMHIIDNFLC